MARPYLGGSNAAIKTLTATTVLTHADSGKTFLLDGSGVEDAALRVTLPSAKAGVDFRFIVKAIGNEAAEDIEIHQAGASDDFVGFIISGGDTIAAAASDNTKIVFDQSGGGANVGDWVYMISDGTNWYISGAMSTNSDIDIAV